MCSFCNILEESTIFKTLTKTKHSHSHIERDDELERILQQYNNIVLYLETYAVSNPNDWRIGNFFFLFFVLFFFFF